MLGEPLVVHLAAERAQLPVDLDMKILRPPAFVEPRAQFRAQFVRYQVKWLLVHRALVPDRPLPFPGKREQHSLVVFGILFEAFLQDARDRALGASDRSVQKEYSTFRAVALGGRLETVDEVHEGAIKPVDGISVPCRELGEESVSGDFFLV